VLAGPCRGISLSRDGIKIFAILAVRNGLAIRYGGAEERDMPGQRGSQSNWTEVDVTSQS
jgi:hypothetical protein